MPARQLNIRSDEAATRASRIAKALGQTTTRVVEDALRDYEEKTTSRAPRQLTPEQGLRFDALLKIAAKARAHVLPNADWDDSWMYDENGLPK